MSTDHRPAIRPPVYLAVPVVQPEPVHHLLERRQGRRRQPRRLCRYMCRDVCATVNYLMSICKGHLNTPNNGPVLRNDPSCCRRACCSSAARSRNSRRTHAWKRALLCQRSKPVCVCVCVSFMGETRKASSIHPSIHPNTHTHTNTQPTTMGQRGGPPRAWLSGTRTGRRKPSSSCVVRSRRRERRNIGYCTGPSS